ncbi:MAG: M28 family metallopeptidase [Pseudomonadota bacterium]
MGSNAGLRAAFFAAFLAVAGCGDASKDGADAPGARATASGETVAANRSAAGATIDAIVDAEALRKRIETLSSDAFAGRAPVTQGGRKTRDYLIAQMKAIGLQPGVGDSYEQAVPLVEVALRPEQSFFAIDGERLAPRTEAVYWTKRVVDEIAFDDSDVVFVGYGVVAPEYGWNDYDGLDVKDKTVVMLINDPGFATGDDDLFNGRAMTYYGRWTYKYEEAARQGAAAAIVIHQTDPASYPWGVVEGGWSGPQLDLERPDGGAGRAALEAWIQEDVARRLFDNAGLDFDAVQKAARTRGFKAIPMGDLKASGKVVNSIRRNASANVVGVLPGDERPDEYVLYMAHWDHLGRMFGQKGDDVANGAVDNATGTAGVLSVAEAFAKADDAPDRSILVVAVTAEESGLLGSAYFGERPTVPLENIVGGVNIDAFLPTPPSKDVIVVGYGASELEDLLKTAATARGRYLRPDAKPEAGYFYRSDHISLAKKGVPMLYAKSGVDLVAGGEAAGQAFAADYTANRYHKPSDEYDPSWDLTGVAGTHDLLYEVGAGMAYSDDWPNWYDGNEFRALRDAMRAESQ